MLGFLPDRWHEVLFSFLLMKQFIRLFSSIRILFLRASALENISIKLCCLCSSDSTLCCHVRFSRSMCIERCQTKKKVMQLPKLYGYFILLLNFNCPLLHLCPLSFWNTWGRSFSPFWIVGYCGSGWDCPKVIVLHCTSWRVLYLLVINQNCKNLLVCNCSHARSLTILL